MSTDPDVQSQRTYALIVKAYLSGLAKVWSSRVGHLSHMVLLLKFRTSSLPVDAAPAGWEEIFSELVRISPHEYDSFRYVGDFGHLVFATTLFDTFLTDTTRFIFLLRPKSIGKTQGITVLDVINAGSKTELLRTAVEKRARDLSYKSFADRIEFLSSTYGLKIDMSHDTAQALEHFSGVRNVLIHDQAFYELGIADDGAVTHAIRSCPVHPRPISSEEIRGAIRAYDRAGAAITEAVFTHLLKVSVPPELLQLQKAIGKVGEDDVSNRGVG
jgi:hypothetical protein